MAEAYASETLREIKGEQMNSDPEDVKALFKEYITLVEKMRKAESKNALKSLVDGGMRNISKKNKIDDEYSKQMFKGFGVRVKKLEKMMMSLLKGGRRTRRKTHRK
jgi:hypothetical protein